MVSFPLAFISELITHRKYFQVGKNRILVQNSLLERKWNTWEDISVLVSLHRNGGGILTYFLKIKVSFKINPCCKMFGSPFLFVFKSRKYLLCRSKKTPSHSSWRFLFQPKQFINCYEELSPKLERRFQVKISIRLVFKKQFKWWSNLALQNETHG